MAKYTNIFIKEYLVSFTILFSYSKIFKASSLNKFFSPVSLYLHLIISLLSSYCYCEQCSNQIHLPNRNLFLPSVLFSSEITFTLLLAF